MVTPTGYTALDLIGFTDKGPYSSLENYVKNDLAHYAGSIWRCKIDDTTNVTPAENANWTVFVSEPSNLVEASIAPIETSPATAAHAQGSQLFYNDTLYKAKTAIAIGDSLVVDTNIEAAPKVTTQLEAKANTADLGTAAGKDSTDAVTQNDTDLVESGAVYTAVSAVGTRVDNVEENIAPLENDATASQAYAIGEQFMKGDVLYKAKTAIAQGDTFTLNTNYEVADNITDQLGSVNEALSTQFNALGAKNLLNNAGLNSYASNGVTYTKNANGSITFVASASRTETSIYSLFDSNKNGYIKVSELNESVIASIGSGADGIQMTVVYRDSSNAFISTQNIYSKSELTIPNNAYWVRCELQVFAAYSGTLTVYPMIRYKSIEDDTYVPYAMTNRGLTEALFGESEWTPQIYDLNTYKFDLPIKGKCYRIGNVGIALFDFNWNPTSPITISEMLQIRGIPFKVISGNIFANFISTTVGAANNACRGTTGRIYPQPSWTGTIGTATYQFVLFAIGYFE